MEVAKLFDNPNTLLQEMIHTLDSSFWRQFGYIETCMLSARCERSMEFHFYVEKIWHNSERGRKHCDFGYYYDHSFFFLFTDFLMFWCMSLFEFVEYFFFEWFLYSLLVFDTKSLYRWPKRFWHIIWIFEMAKLVADFFVLHFPTWEVNIFFGHVLTIKKSADFFFWPFGRLANCDPP